MMKALKSITTATVFKTLLNCPYILLQRNLLNSLIKDRKRSRKSREDQQA